MRHYVLAILLCFGPFLGCQSTSAYTEHAWKYRAEIVYTHPKLTDDQKRAEIYAMGADLGLSPAVIEADLKEHGYGN